MWLALLGAALMSAACAEITPDELASRYHAESETLSAPSSTPAPTDSDIVDNIPSTDGRPPRAVALTPQFGSCSFDPGGYDVDCGMIVIPSETTGIEPIELAFARFNATGTAPVTDPVVYLHGGPGGAVLAEASGFARTIVEPFIEDRDVILYDQRGAGESSPLPECVEAWDLDDLFFGSNVPHTELRDDYTEALSACATRVTDRSTIAFTEYASATHADDFLDLVRALGYETVNVYGNSYGTRLAQTIMRDHPQPVRSVILSGVYPIEANLIGSTPAAFESAFAAIAEGCLAVPSCADDLPDPVATLRDTVAALDANPPTFDIPFDDVSTFPFVLSGDDLINILHGLLYGIDGAAMIPDLLIDLDAGDVDRLERIAPDGIYNTSDVGGYLGVQCREEVPFTTEAERERSDRDESIWERINLPPGLLSADLIEVCDAWASFGVADPLENEPVTWTQPTLILSGGFDPITPPEWARTVARRLPNAALAFSADRGHDADEGDCAMGLMASFVDSPNPSLDTSCTLEFDVPFVTTTNVRQQDRNRIVLAGSVFDIDPGPETEWIDMLLPDWEFDFYEDEEAYWRNLDPYDSTLIVLRSGPFDPDELTWYLPFETTSLTFAATDLPASVGAGWNRSRADTVSYDIVSYVSTGTPEMNISVIARPEDLDELEKTAVMPMVNSVPTS